MDAATLPLSRARPEKLAAPVVGAGLVTTALTLFALWQLELNAMGWYLWFVVPAGAIGVGLVAGSGYGAASWFSGVKISRGVLWTVLGLQVGAYFVAQYLVFRELAEQAGVVGASFLLYFDEATRSIAFKKDGGGVGDSLGAFGYAFRLLEIAGFAGGSLLVPLGMKSKPYCEGCQIYMRTKELGRLPAGTPAKKPGKKPGEAEAYEAAHAEGANEGAATLDRILGFAAAGDARAVTAELAPHRPHKSAYAKLTSRIELWLVSCRQCRNGWVASSVVSGQGENITHQPLEPVGVPPELVRDLQA